MKHITVRKLVHRIHRMSRPQFVAKNHTIMYYLAIYKPFMWLTLINFETVLRQCMSRNIKEINILESLTKNELGHLL